ncbi:unnamed protein product, partial [Ceratitis capitata]
STSATNRANIPWITNTVVFKCIEFQWAITYITTLYTAYLLPTNSTHQTLTSSPKTKLQTL